MVLIVITVVIEDGKIALNEKYGAEPGASEAERKCGEAMHEVVRGVQRFLEAKARAKDSG